MVGFAVESNFSHASVPNLENVETQVDFERLLSAVDKGLLKLGREANVVGFGDIAGHNYQMNVASIHLTSKLGASSRNLVNNLKVTIAAVREVYPERVITACSSDRDALFSQALHQLCTDTGLLLDESSAVGAAMFGEGESYKKMDFFSRRCGHSEQEPMVVDADAKHGGKSLRRAFKRPAFLFLHVKSSDTLLKQLVLDLGFVDADDNDVALTSAVKELWGEGELNDSQNVAAMVRFFMVMGKMAKMSTKNGPSLGGSFPTRDRTSTTGWPTVDSAAA